ncbi:MAG: SAM-dependent methyltransferase [Proteobacteria bacterium]|nr:SAM-dependent methyltransferase [Pseudomonadota bacterium]
MNHLPLPSQEALAHQQKLLRFLVQIIAKKGPLSFAEFMASALYAPGLGYYSAGAQKFGESGDFVTAPEISALFSNCLARQCAQILATLSKQAVILELGAGSGKMAAALLTTLKNLNQLPAQYFILEVSADLKQRQQQYLKQHCQDYFKNIVWLDKLPEQAVEGIILGNEVLDAMPVELFQIGENGELLQAYVNYENEQWQCTFSTDVKEKVKDAILALQTQLGYQFAPKYTSEINVELAPWVSALSNILSKGVMLFIDYGFPNHEYYHPSRHMGTLMCHYRHHAHPDPLRYIGLQDITAHVDFSALAKAAMSAQCDVLGYTTQAAFLLSNNILENHSLDAQEQLKISQQIQKLTAPHEMGELFKVMALGKNYDEPLQGFSLRDYKHRL